MFSVCRQSHPATGIEFSITCRFFNNAEENIVTGGANVLKVFRIIPDVDPTTTEKFTDIRPPKMRLECLATYELFGNVMSLQSVSLSGSQRDALLISFKDAKLSVVQHDPDSFELKTLSLHYFEEEDIKGGWVGNYNIPMVKVDPDNRCAVMVVYGKKLVVLPFRRDSSLDEIEVQDVKPMKKTPLQLIARTPILASYTITLKDLDEKIDNVIDIEFLHGYYEPTLLILYEPVRTFPGRIAVRNDTCTMVAISLNIQQRVHPIIWTVTSLPFDCTRVLPIKKPIGGCLVLAHNSIIYLNQSVPPYGVSLNSVADHSTNFPLKPQDGVKISLDCAQIAFIATDKLVLSLRGGELFVLTLCADSLRYVRNFHFSKAASSVLTSCMCVCLEEYIFLGSRLGNSLLVRFTEQDQDTIITIDDSDISGKEKEKEKEKETNKRLEEELEVYGSGLKTSVQLTSYTFEVCDTFLNIGPIGSMTIGERGSEDDYDDEHKLKQSKNPNAKPELEIVTSSGKGKNGALCVLQNSVKPQILTTFELPGFHDVWTVFNESAQKNSTHSFMVLSQDASTTILQTGDEINEVNNTGFCINQTTIHVGNIGNNRYIVQVLSRSMRLLQGSRLIQNIQIDSDSPIVQVSICDPYVCAQTQSGAVITWALRENKGISRLAINKNTISNCPAVISLCAYKDVSGLFTTKVEDYSDPSMNPGHSYSGNGFGYMKPEPHNMKIEDEEDLLYGESGSTFQMKNLADLAKPSNTKKSDWWRRHIQPKKPTFWLFVLRNNGNLEIYFMPDMKLAYIVTNVGNGNKFLSDSMEFVPLALSQQHTDNMDGTSFSANDLVTMPTEVFVVGLGSYSRRTILFIRTKVDLLIYQVYRYTRGHLKIRFRKMSHGIMIPISDNPAKMEIDEEGLIVGVTNRLRTIRYFENISGNSGVIVTGDKPYLILLTGTGELRTHQFHHQIVMKSFAPFNNQNCQGGFIYFDQKNDLQIAVFPSYLQYDTHWPVRKVPLRCTPTAIVYHKETKVYCVVTYTEEESRNYFRFNGEDKELTEENKGERFIYPTKSQFEVLLVAPTKWEIVPDTSIKLDDWEHVVSFKNVHLAYEGTLHGFREYICIGTNYNYSEDITSRGRMLLYDIIEVVPEPGKPLTKYKLKEICIKEQKGPVSAISHVLGFLVTAVGQKIYLWQLKDNDLNGVAFIDTNIFVHQIVSIKSLILVADMYKSISILRFQQEYRTLSIVSRDYNPMNVLNIEYIVDNSNLGFLASDCEENFSIFMYQPESRESYGGQKLIRKADYHLGQRVNAMFRIQCNYTRILNGNYDNKHTTYFATLDGGLGYLLPLPEKTYRRLFMLQNVLLLHIEHLCGLNPKQYRTIKTVRRFAMNPARCILDGDLLWLFSSLPINEKQEMAKKIGTKMEEIVADLMEIDNVTSVF